MAPMCVYKNPMNTPPKDSINALENKTEFTFARHEAELERRATDWFADRFASASKSRATNSMPRVELQFQTL